jgi:hypothetical protein
MSENRANDAMERVERAANTASRPSDLKITDLRVTRIKASYDYILVRIDTNQGVYGIGEQGDCIKRRGL